MWAETELQFVSLTIDTTVSECFLPPQRVLEHLAVARMPVYENGYLLVPNAIKCVGADLQKSRTARFNTKSCSKTHCV